MKYQFLLQNITSKQAYTWLLEDLTPESIYHKFDIDLDEGMKDGEYEWILIENPNELEIEININDIAESYLIGGDTVIETFGLMRIGSYTNPLQYNKTNKYTVYERK